MPRPKLPEVIVWAVAACLLAVVVGLRVGAGRHGGYVAEMREEMRRVAVAQESFRYDVGVYAADVTALEQRGFEPDTDVVIQVREATADGWAAVVAHHRTASRCYLYVRTAAPVGAARRDGSLECD